MYCSKCGKQIDDDAVICVYCGVPTAKFNAQKDDKPQVVINNTNTNTNANVNTNINGGRGEISPKSKAVAMMLCIFTGFFGGHQFYAGRFGTGILYVFTAGLFFIGWFRDIALIASGRFRDAQGRRIVR